MPLFTIDSAIERASTLPAKFYTDKDIFEQLKYQVFARSWQWICDADVVKLQGDVYPFNFLDGFVDEPLLFTHDERGEIHCLSNVCTHRGNILVKNAGNAQQLQCGYHGRRFGLNGDFKHMPGTQGMENFPSATDSLPKAPFKKWFNFLFASINPAYDFEIVIDDIEARVGWMPVKDFRFDASRSQDYLVKANWALYVDNYLEGFHIPFIHKELAQALEFGDYASELYEFANLQLGIGKTGDVLFDLPTTSPDYGKNVAAYYYWLFPNLMLNFYPWGLSINIVKPIAPELSRISYRTYVWDETKLNSGAGGNLEKVEREDQNIVESVQRGVKSHLYQKGRFSPTMEKGVHHFHFLLASLMNG